ncbi:MAG: class I SAM-dependent methyltransferase [Candidatus Velthaea sp.]
MPPFLDYDAFADLYAECTRNNLFNARYERPALRALVPPVSGKRALDAGCAAGEHARWLCDQGATVTAIDVSEAMIARAIERLGSDARVVRHDLDEPLPFLDGAFDVIVSSLALHYARDLSSTLREFARVLSPHGVLVFSTHHPMLANAGERYSETHVIDEMWDGYGTMPVRVRWYHRSFEAIFRALEDARFTIEAIREPMPDPAFATENPDAYAQMRRTPFLLVRARHPG